MDQDRGAVDEMIRVLVADSTRIHTQLLADALKRDPSLSVFTASSDSQSVVSAAKLYHVDVAVISSNLDEEPLRGCEIMRELRVSQPRIRTVLLLDSSRRETVLEGFRAGARGIFSRHESVDGLAKCIRSVHEGQIWANSQQMRLAVEALASAPTVRAVDANGFNLLSKRELEVVHCLAEGLTNREIAERLGLSQHTIKNYLFRVFDKLGVSSRIELLFLTLSQAGAPSPQNGKGGSPEAAGGAAYVREAAEQGLLSAQITLAEMYARGDTEALDAVSAYAWYLIASDQLLAARKNLTKVMTMDQLLEAEQKAAEWLRKSRKTPRNTSQDHAPAASLVTKVSTA